MWKDYLPYWMTIAWQALLVTGGVLATVGTALVWSYHKLLRPAKAQYSKLNTFVDRVNKVLDAHPKMQSAIERISYEVQSNSGSSLKDEVKEIRRTVGGIEARQKARFESESDIAFFTDANGEVEAVSGGYTELTGLDTHRAQREGWRQVIHPEDVDRVALAWHAAVSQQTLFSSQFRYTHITQGGSVPCKVTATPVMSGGAVTGWSGNVKRLAPLAFAPDPEAIEAVNDIFAAHAREYEQSHATERKAQQ